MFGNDHNLSESKVSPIIKFGNQCLAITGYEIKESKTGSKMVSLKVESPTVTAEGFKPMEGNLRGGQVGRVQFTIYMKNPASLSGEEQTKAMKAYQEMEKRIQIIASKLGEDVLNKVKEVSKGTDSLESFLDAVIPVISKKDLWFQVCAKEYDNSGEYPKYSLHFGRFGFVASLTEGEGHLTPFDKTNKYHYEAMEAADAPSTPANTTSSPSNGAW